MNPRRGVLKGVVTVLMGQLGSKALSFATTVLTARLLGPENWGVAASFVVVLTVIEAVSTLSADRQVVQAKDGGSSDFLATAHGVMIARGVTLSAIIFASSWGAAWLFDRAEALWAYQTLALIPLIRSFSHLGVFALQRSMRFKETALVEIGSYGTGLLVGLPIAYILRDYSAALWMLIVQSAARTTITHILSNQPYRVRWHRTHAQRLMQFGWPLMLNGIIMYALLQGDQTIVGAWFDMPTLGAYAAAFNIATVPTLMIAGLASTTILPKLSEVQDNIPLLTRRIARTSEVLALVGGLVGIAFVLFGPLAVHLLYGSKFELAAGVVSVLAAAWSLRVLRVAPTLAAMARSDTLNLLLSNVWRCVGLVGAITAALQGANVVWIAASAIIGELCAIIASCARLHKRQGIPFRTCGLPALVAALVIGTALGLQVLVEKPAPWLLFAACFGLSGVLAAGLIASCPGAAREARAALAMLTHNRYGSSPAS